MSNQYGVVVPDGPEFPTQEFVDSVLNEIDAIPTCQDLQKLMDMGEAEAKAYIARKIDEATEKFNNMFEDLKASLERRMQPIKSLMDLLQEVVTPPSSIDDVIGYLGKVANLFTETLQYLTKPYTQMVQVMAFYLQFGAAVSTALGNKIGDTGCLVSFSLPNISIPQPPSTPGE